MDDTIDVITWMIKDRLKYSERQHKQKVSKNQTPDEEEAEADKSEHQTSVLKRKNSQESLFVIVGKEEFSSPSNRNLPSTTQLCHD